MSELDRLLGHAASDGLTITGHLDLLPTAPDAIHESLLSAAIEHRIPGLLAQAVAGCPLQTWRSEDVVAAHLAALRTALVCEATAVLATCALTTAGISSRALKGVALAHLDYPDPSIRTFGDADILVPRDAFAAAAECLCREGITRAEPPVHPWWERRYGKAAVFCTPDQAEIDLHLTLTGGYFGLAIPSDDLFSVPGEPFELAGVMMTALPLGMRLMQAAYHTVLGGGSGLRAKRDVVQLALKDGSLDEARHWAQRWRGEAVLATAIVRSWDALYLPHDHPAVVWADGYRISPADQARIDGYTSHLHHGWAREGRDAAAALSWPNKIAYVAGLAIPSRDSLRARGRTFPQQIRRVLTKGRG
jgi:hypothetical protein